ncbi:MmcQ/YjbR family DNA-binding protein [Bartonella apihabitans]|uniref:MmcQ/YjbR family DNA-binding protein n=1 Tax=Bartonella apihabitans TaxID=2750929 RepID=UPI003BB5A254
MCIDRPIAALYNVGFLTKDGTVFKLQSVRRLQATCLSRRTVILKSSSLPAYQMNKDSWITIFLDGTVSMKEICDLIDQSYFLTQ